MIIVNVLIEVKELKKFKTIVRIIIEDDKLTIIQVEEQEKII
jgi:hypothetical protein